MTTWTAEEPPGDQDSRFYLSNLAGVAIRRWTSSRNSVRLDVRTLPVTAFGAPSPAEPWLEPVHTMIQ